MDMPVWMRKTLSRGSEMRVGICGAAQQAAEVLLSRMVSGDMFGSEHSLQLTLQDSANKLEDLQLLAEDLMDGCYPLLSDDNDVIILLMPRRIPHHDSHELLREVVNAVQDYAKGLNLLSTLVLQDKVIVVAGGMASVAAGILATLSPHLHPHHVLAVEVPAYDDQTAKQEGGYRLSEMICQAVHQWWSGVQERKELTVGMGCYHGIPRMPSLCFLPMPVKVIAPLTLEVSSDAHPEWNHIKQQMDNFSQALSILGLAERPGRQSIMCACKL
ncbi:uncharacterized protein LOC112571348 isoform X2 [Pomacea canaliculata]|uniref:uncharacterized protein LOC112571348 isoform X2 n=1 Tax=Pomacea canaliculata TaxID=400727 RepID=UPI000D725F13|nr:uncharacterized protein LOC112571348 isoform X2 [Pomacea canaliculata]